MNTFKNKGKGVMRLVEMSDLFQKQFGREAPWLVDSEV